jgi:hypothetical protein
LQMKQKKCIFLFLEIIFFKKMKNKIKIRFEEKMMFVDILSKMKHLQGKLI